MADRDADPIAALYRRFAEREARGRSPLYEDLTRQVAADAAVISFLMTLPGPKRQPNLLLASVRHLCGLQTDYQSFRHAVLTEAARLRAFMLTHATQTNEPNRCAVLLPILSRLPQPLALLEVGASAGLCLMPDLYAYDYSGTGRGGTRIGPKEAPEDIRGDVPGDMSEDAPVMRCEANAGMPLPPGLPDVTRRAGLDLEPLDPGDPAQAAWLEALVWPEQTARLAGLRAALRLAARVRPVVTRGDLLGEDLDRLSRDAPDGATRVIFHTAVVAYVPDAARRRAFADKVRRICDYWIANEAPSVFPDIAGKTGAGQVPEGPSGRFLLSVNGQPVAWTDPHGTAMTWFGPDPATIPPYPA